MDVSSSPRLAVESYRNPLPEQVRNMSPASFGLMVGDRIVKVGGRRVKDVKSINRIIASEAKNVKTPKSLK